VSTSARNTTLTSNIPVGAPRLPGAPAPQVLPARPEPLALHATDSALDDGARPQALADFFRHRYGIATV